MTERATWGLTAGDELVPGRVVIERLGGGALAEVYLVTDEELLAPVVAKVVRPDQVDDRGRRKLATEAETLGALRHPMILRLIDADLEGERPHLVLEHLEGPRLSRLLRRHGALSLEQVAPLAVQLCSALHYLHGRGIVHLDVKPGNVVMDAVPRLIDLGVARTVEAARALREPVGTDAYMAPEQCEPVAAAGVGPPADVWGAAVTLHQAAVGRRPFPRARDVGERFPQLTREPEPLPETLPAALREAIAAGLARAPEERPTAEELAGLIEPLVAALPRRPVLGRMRPRFTAG